MSKMAWLILLSVISTLFILFGVISKIQHWEATKPFMLIGMGMQICILGYGIFVLFRKNAENLKK